MREFDSGPKFDNVQTEGLEPWVAPRLIALDKIAEAEKVSWNTEHSSFSGLS